MRHGTLDLQSLPFRLDLDHAERLLKRRGQVEPGRLDAALAGVDACHVEDLRDDVEQEAAGVLDVLGVLAMLLDHVRADHAHLDHL